VGVRGRTSSQQAWEREGAVLEQAMRENQQVWEREKCCNKKIKKKRRGA
jgi:hypothetical protein